MIINYNISELSKTQKLAITISSFLKKGDSILLKGDLGSGKTTFSQFLIKQLTGVLNVPSPTFTIVNMYESKIAPIYHFDLYRLKNTNELHELGFEESLFTGITIIEWPDLAENIIHNNKIIISFSHKHEPSARTVTIDLQGRFLNEPMLLKELKDGID